MAGLAEVDRTSRRPIDGWLTRDVSDLSSGMWTLNGPERRAAASRSCKIQVGFRFAREDWFGRDWGECPNARRRLLIFLRIARGPYATEQIQVSCFRSKATASSDRRLGEALHEIFGFDRAFGFFGGASAEYAGRGPCSVLARGRIAAARIWTLRQGALHEANLLGSDPAAPACQRTRDRRSNGWAGVLGPVSSRQVELTASIWFSRRSSDGGCRGRSEERET